MKIIENIDIKKALSKSKRIGKGTTADCYLLSNGKVLKLYKDTYEKNNMFNYHDMNEQLKMLHEISNNSFIGPDTIIKNKKGEVIGYLYKYIEGKTLDKIPPKTDLHDFTQNYFQLLEDTKAVSEFNFRIKDLHRKNIIYKNGSFYIIDLDKGEKVSINDVEASYRYNMKKINDTIIKGLFNIGEGYNIAFYNYKLQELYNKISRDPRYMELFIEKISKCCFNKNNVSELRLIKRHLLYSENDSYLKH